MSRSMRIHRKRISRSLTKRGAGEGGVHACIWRDTGWVGREGGDGEVLRVHGRVVRVRRGCTGDLGFVSPCPLIFFSRSSISGGGGSNRDFVLSTGGIRELFDLFLFSCSLTVDLRFVSSSPLRASPG